MGNKSILEKESYRISIMLILLVISVFLTYYFHFVLILGVIFTQFFYFPIFLAAIWWRKKGILIPIFLSVLLISSYFLAPNLNYPFYEDLIRAFMFMAIGIVVAFLSEDITKKILNSMKTRKSFVL
jgi:hypothetical protein